MSLACQAIQVIAEVDSAVTLDIQVQLVREHLVIAVYQVILGFLVILVTVVYQDIAVIQDLAFQVTQVIVALD
jgi:hypothetical protein